MSEFKTIRGLISNSGLEVVDIKSLIRYVTGLSPVELITRSGDTLGESDYAKLQELIRRRKQGEPMSYITGYREFYSRNFKVTGDTLIPRPETELLVDIALKLSKNGDKILDLGTGSGCIGITIKLENQCLEVIGVDKYPATLDIAMQNADRLGARVEFIQSDWFSNIQQAFNLIVSNPPYIASDDIHLANLCYEPLPALTDGDDGYRWIRVIIQNSRDHLISGGYLILEHGYNQAEEVRKCFIDCGFVEVLMVKDYSNNPRVTFGIFSK